MEAFQRAERETRVLQFQNDEATKNQDRMSDLATKLQAKFKTYKKQIDDAKRITTLSLAKQGGYAYALESKYVTVMLTSSKVKM